MTTQPTTGANRAIPPVLRTEVSSLAAHLTRVCGLADGLVIQFPDDHGLSSVANDLGVALVRVDSALFALEMREGRS